MPGAPPFPASWPSSPKGDARTLRDLLSVSYDLKTILLTGSLRSPPFGGCATTFPPQAGGTTNRVKLRVTYERIASRSFVLPLLAGEVPRSGQGGMPFRRPSGRLYGFSRQRRHKKWRPKGRRTSPAQRYFIPPEGGALNPSGRRQPVPDRTLGAQGRQARRRHQPSRP